MYQSFYKEDFTEFVDILAVALKQIGVSESPSITHARAVLLDDAPRDPRLSPVCRPCESRRRHAVRTYAPPVGIPAAIAGREEGPSSTHLILLADGSGVRLPTAIMIWPLSSGQSDGDKQGKVSKMLEVENLTVSVEGKTLLKDISLHIEEGETRMLFGENGSGKTSLLMAIMGLGDYKVESGRIIFKGVDITALPTNERARMGIGIMFQRPPTIRGLKVEEMLDLIKRDGSDPEELAAELNFTDFLDRDLNLGFSGGEIKRAELLQLMAQDPDLVLLDEPESGVDLVNISVIGNAIRRLLQKDVHVGRKKSGLIITHSGHILDYVEADKGCVLVNETIWCTGNPHEILQGIREHGYEGCLTCQR